jgi:VanZ family protein
MIRKNKISILIALIILFLSLSKSETFDTVQFINIPHLDKIVHFLMYFVLMLSLVYENRFHMIKAKNIFLLAIIPVLYGISIEFMQAYLTITRSGEFYDVCFNTLGVLFAALLWMLFKITKKPEFK